METNTIRRFLFESAIYLDLDPALALYGPAAEAGRQPDEDPAADCIGDSQLLQLCKHQQNRNSPHLYI